MQSKYLDDPIRFQKALKRKPEKYWIGRGEKMAMQLFGQMAERVPAYKDFLSKNNFNPKSVKKLEDFKKVK